MSEVKELTISWSKLRTWMNCKQHAFLTGKVKNPSQDVRVFFRGTVTDKILCNWLREESPEPGVMASRVDEYMELCERNHIEQGTGVVRWKSTKDKGEMSEWCKRLLVKVEPLMYKLVIPYSRETDFRFKAPITIPGIDGSPRIIYLIGAMDILVDHLYDDFAIYDLKATENESYWRKTIMQLVFYDLGLNALKGVYPTRTALIQPMCTEQVLNLKITDEHRLQLVTKIIDYAHSVWREDFSPKADDAGCSWCPVKPGCSKFKKLATGKDRRISWVSEGEL